MDIVSTRKNRRENDKNKTETNANATYEMTATVDNAEGNDKTSQGKTIQRGCYPTVLIEQYVWHESQHRSQRPVRLSRI